MKKGSSKNSESQCDLIDAKIVSSRLVGEISPPLPSARPRVPCTRIRRGMAVSP